MSRKMISDKQWRRIHLLLPGKVTDSGVTAKDNRLFLEAVLWIVRCGAPWRDLPSELGHWNSVYIRYNRWCKKGIWANLFEELAKDKDCEYIMVDGSIVRVHQHGVPKKKNKISRPSSGSLAVV